MRAEPLKLGAWTPSHPPSDPSMSDLLTEQEPLQAPDAECLGASSSDCTLDRSPDSNMRAWLPLAHCPPAGVGDGRL
ncbi:unnamed protein product [Gadus morhua 'NCC']